MWLMSWESGCCNHLFAYNTISRNGSQLKLAVWTDGLLFQRAVSRPQLKSCHSCNHSCSILKINYHCISESFASLCREYFQILNKTARLLRSINILEQMTSQSPCHGWPAVPGLSDTLESVYPPISLGL